MHDFRRRFEEFVGAVYRGFMMARNVLSLKTYTYLPTSADPFTTTITLVGGRVSEIERVRKF